MGSPIHRAARCAGVARRLPHSNQSRSQVRWRRASFAPFQSIAQPRALAPRVACPIPINRAARCAGAARRLPHSNQTLTGAAPSSCRRTLMSCRNSS